MNILWPFRSPNPFPTCAGCGSAIHGPEVQALGKHWHPQHLRCAVCHAPLPTTFLVSHHQEPFCHHHEADAALCSACGHAVPLGGMRGGCCPGCAREIPRDEGEAADILRRVQHWLRVEGLPWWPQTFPVRLVAKDGFQPIQGVHSGPVAGQILTRLSSDHRGRPLREVEEIRVLKGSPRLVVEALLAHELGHAWIFQKGITGLPHVLEEGFCQWLSHRWLGSTGDPRAPFLMERIAQSPDLIYGEGYRQAQRLAGAGGLRSLITALHPVRETPHV